MGVGQTRIETDDLNGETKCYSGTVGTSSIAIPTVADKVIAYVTTLSNEPAASGKVLSVSFDGESTWYDLSGQEHVSVPVRGRRKQIHIKGSAANTNYKMIVQMEDK